MSQNDDYEGWIEGDFASALYVALDRLEELDPSVVNEDWFKFIGQTVDKTLAPHFEKAHKKLH